MAMIEIPAEFLYQLIYSLFLIVTIWVISFVVLFYLSGRDILNNLKLFFYNKFRGSGWGLVRTLGQDLRERSQVRKIGGLYSIDNGTYAGTPDVTFTREGYPLRQHVQGVVNAVDLLQRKSRLVTFKINKAKCKKCGEDVELGETKIENLAVPVPEKADVSNMIEHAVAMAQTTHPEPGLNPKTIKWIAIMLIGIIFGVALISLFTNPAFPEFLGTLSQAR